MLSVVVLELEIPKLLQDIVVEVEWGLPFVHSHATLVDIVADLIKLPLEECGGEGVSRDIAPLGNILADSLDALLD